MRKVRFILPPGTHTSFNDAVVGFGSRDVIDGQVVAEEEIGYPGAKHFVDRGMAEWFGEDAAPHGGADD